MCVAVTGVGRDVELHRRNGLGRLGEARPTAHQGCCRECTDQDLASCHYGLLGYEIRWTSGMCPNAPRPLVGISSFSSRIC
jgi:hypothetical protein